VELRPGFAPQPTLLLRAAVAASLSALLCGAGTGGAPPEQLGPQSARPAVVLTPSSSAENALDVAERLADEGRWGDAAALLQSVVEGEPSDLVRQGGRYASARDAASQRLAELPDEGLAAYRLLYDAPARALYEEGVQERDEAALRQAASVYLNSSYGPRAASALATLLMDGGEHGAALRALAPLAALNLGPEQAAAVAVKKAACLRRLGGATGGWSPAGPRRPAPLGCAAEVQFSIRLPGPVPPRDLPGSPPIQSAADGGTVFVNLYGAVTAIDRHEGGLRWARGPDGEPLLAAFLRGRRVGVPPPEPILLPVESVEAWRVSAARGTTTLALDSGRLYAVHVDLGLVATPGAVYELTPGDIRFTNELRCYAAEDGRVVWRAGGARAGRLSGFWFFSAPAIDSGRAYVMGARSGRLWALCVDAASGRAVWEAPIGLLASGQETERWLMESYLADSGPPVVVGGVLVCPTGHGVVCGFDAYEGRLLWATPYRRAQRHINRLGQDLAVGGSSWRASPPLSADGLCIMANLDSSEVLALQPATGQVAWARGFGRGRAVLGVRDGRVYVQHRGLTCLDAATGDTLWEAGEGDNVAGVGALGPDGVYVPVVEGVAERDLQTGGTGRLMHWPPGEGAWGNLLVDEGLTVLCPERVTAFRPVAVGEASSAGAGATPEAALLRAAGGAATGLARTYAELVAAHGMDMADGPHAAASRWTVLAELVRTAAGGDRALDSAWARQFTDVVDAAGSAGDEGTLLAMAHWAPFGEARRAALRALGGLWDRQGRPDASRLRRASESARAAADRERQGWPIGRGDRESGPFRPVWSVRGQLVLPAGAADASTSDRVLVADGGVVSCLQAADGTCVWRAAVVEAEVAGSGGGATSRGGTVDWGAGYPSYGMLGGRLVVALDGVVAGVEPADGTIAWREARAGRGPASHSRRTLRRGRLIRRMLNGLPVPDPASAVYAPLDSFLFTPVACCRVDAAEVLSVVDAASGAELFRLDAGPEQELVGVHAVSDGARLLLSSPPGPRLVLVDLRTGVRVAEWRLKGSPGALSMVAGPDHDAYVADWDAIVRLDMAEARVVWRREVTAGVDRLLHVGAEVLVASTLDAGILALSPADGTDVLAARAAGGWVAAWAASAGGAITTLETKHLADLVPHGPGCHYRGGPFRLRAVSLGTGDELWTAAVCEASRCDVGPPCVGDGEMLLALSEPERVRAVSVDARSGVGTDLVERESEGGVPPAAVQVVGGRVVLSAGGRTEAYGADP
jgi:outer membrane protein assembly factor BamB